MENQNDMEYAPYAPVANILMLIHRLRERGLPEVLDHRELVKLGLPEESSPRIRKALQFLSFTNDQNKQTASFQRLGRATDEEYPDILRAILEDAYSDVFQSLGDLSAAQEKDYNNAFRYYNPQGQRSSMIRLFMALCQEAGMLPEGTSSKVSATRQPQKTSRTRPTTIRKASQQDRGVNTDASTTQGDSATRYRDEKNAIDVGEKYALLQVLLAQLPTSGVWTQKRHDQWLKAIETSVDLLVDVVEVEDEKQSKQQQLEIEM